VASKNDFVTNSKQTGLFSHNKMAGIYSLS